METLSKTHRKITDQLKLEAMGLPLKKLKRVASSYNRNRAVNLTDSEVKAIEDCNLWQNGYLILFGHQIVVANNRAFSIGGCAVK